MVRAAALAAATTVVRCGAARHARRRRHSRRCHQRRLPRTLPLLPPQHQTPVQLPPRLRRSDTSRRGETGDWCDCFSVPRDDPCCRFDTSHSPLVCHAGSRSIPEGHFTPSSDGAAVVGRRAMRRFGVHWELANVSQSCTDACDAVGRSCAAPASGREDAGLHRGAGRSFRMNCDTGENSAVCPLHLHKLRRHSNHGLIRPSHPSATTSLRARVPPCTPSACARASRRRRRQACRRACRPPPLQPNADAECGNNGVHWRLSALGQDCHSACSTVGGSCVDLPMGANTSACTGRSRSRLRRRAHNDSSSFAHAPSFRVRRRYFVLVVILHAQHPPPTTNASARAKHANSPAADASDGTSSAMRRECILPKTEAPWCTETTDSWCSDELSLPGTCDTNCCEMACPLPTTPPPLPPSIRRPRVRRQVPRRARHRRRLFREQTWTAAIAVLAALGDRPELRCRMHRRQQLVRGHCRWRENARLLVGARGGFCAHVLEAVRVPNRSPRTS